MVQKFLVIVFFIAIPFFSFSQETMKANDIFGKELENGYFRPYDCISEGNPNVCYDAAVNMQQNGQFWISNETNENMIIKISYSNYPSTGGSVSVPAKKVVSYPGVDGDGKMFFEITTPSSEKKGNKISYDFKTQKFTTLYGAAMKSGMKGDFSGRRRYTAKSTKDALG